MPSLKPLLLHAHRTGPNPIKIAIALELLSVPYKLQFWQLGDDPSTGVKSARFLAINENGRVPALEDPNTGVVAWESGAIMNYVRRVYDADGKVLGPKEQGEQARVDFEKWEYFLLTTLGPMTGQANWYRRYNPVKNDDAMARYAAQTHRCYAVLEAQLAKTAGASVLPGGLTAVDLHFLPWVKQHTYAQLSIDEYPNMKKWLAATLELPEVKRAYDRVTNDPVE